MLKTDSAPAQCGRVDAKPEKTDQPPAFEEALRQLESIVESMETGRIPLAEMLDKYEQGTRILKVCEARLKEAGMKIEILKKQKTGAPAFAPFPVATHEEF
jgi:exodeoxyribonuclease VII small subunit